MKIKSPPGCYIEKVEVDQLFGESDVRIEVARGADPRLIVIYGQNGSGKTTILELIRSMLSPDDNAGHRTRIAQIPFSRASIRLSGGVSIDAKKREGLTGSFDWSIKKPGKETLFLHLKPTSGRILADSWDATQGQRHAEMLAELQSIVGRVVSLDDKRTFYVPEERSSRLAQRRLPDGRVVHYREPGERGEDDNDPVYIGLSEVVSSVRREALLLSNRGTQGAQSIYTTLIKKILANADSEFSAVDSIEELARQLNEAEERSRNLSKYGLVAPVQHQPMLDALSKVGSSQQEVIASVVSPYIESLSARFNAVQNLHQELGQWIENLNSFLSPKSLRFKVGEDIQITSRSGLPLSAKDLSSGERHLLLLLTKAFQLRSSGGLMLVDEPELSLNSIWQRGLVHSMLQSFGGAGCQLVVASHSLEIAAKYQANLVNISSTEATEADETDA